MSGTVIITISSVGNKSKKVEIIWTANSLDGSVPRTEFDSAIIADIQEKYCILAITDPGSPAPTDQYDIKIFDEYSVDIFGGELNNRSTINTEQAVPKIGNGYGGRLCAGPWTFRLSGNSVNSAQGKCVLYFER